MAKVIMYSSAYCPFCHRAQALLENKQAEYDVISVDGQPQMRAQMVEKAGRTSVPQIWVGDEHVGGCDELYALERKGQLEPLLSA